MIRRGRRLGGESGRGAEVVVEMGRWQCGEKGLLSGVIGSERVVIG